MRLRAFVLGLATLTAGASAVGPVASSVSGPCVSGDADRAAETLYGRGTEVARTDRVAGLETALVMQPYIAPGTRHRMIAISSGWCDAETGFNRAWTANGRALTNGSGVAAAYARLAAAPYFDQTTVLSHSGSGGRHIIRTHALTNGVEAAWTIVTDERGIQAAAWATTGFAVRPLVAQWEGLTALAGASERYTRLGDGELVAARGLPTGQLEDPAAEVSYTGPDGFKIVVGISDSRNAVDAGMDTGNSKLDILRMTRDVIAENYQDFYDWGFRADWATARTRFLIVNSPVQIPAPPRTGYVAINNSTSAYCLACVFIADDFQIHFISEVRAALEALGYEYPGTSDRDVLADVLGHEMFHDWQNNYYKPTSTGRSVPGSYSEGTARMQETLHAYSGGSHQPGSLVYANDANGCNGYHGTDTNSTAAAGPFNQSYSACNFWLPWYGAEGVGALARLVSEGAPAGAEASTTPAGKMIPAVEIATDKPYAVSAAEWAAGLITKKGMVWGPASDPGTSRNWAQHLERWTPAQLEVGGSVTRTLSGGGVMAVEATQAFRPTVTEGATIAIVRDSAAGASISFPPEGELVQGPVSGQRVYVIAVYPVAGSRSTTLELLTP